MKYTSWCFQPGEGPSRGLLCDCTTSPMNRLQHRSRVHWWTRQLTTRHRHQTRGNFNSTVLFSSYTSGHMYIVQEVTGGPGNCHCSNESQVYVYTDIYFLVSTTPLTHSGLRVKIGKQEFCKLTSKLRFVSTAKSDDSEIVTRHMSHVMVTHPTYCCCTPPGPPLIFSAVQHCNIRR